MGRVRSRQLPWPPITRRSHALIHRPSELPFQGISKFQNTAAEEEKIFEFLSQLLTQPNKVPGREAVNPHLDTEHLRQSCRKLTQLLEPRRAEWKDFGCFVELQIDIDAIKAGTFSIQDAKILAGRKLDTIFGVDGPVGGTLADLIKQINDKDNRGWMDDLQIQITECVEGRSPSFLCACIRAQSSYMYRPFVVAMSEDGPFRKFKVLFAETLSGRSRADKRLLAFQTALRLAFRIRWEVLEEYGQMTTERELRQTRHLLRSIETEGMQDGVMRARSTD